MNKEEPLNRDELRMVLARAKEEAWEQLALLGPKDGSFATMRLEQGWPAERVFLLEYPLSIIPFALVKLVRLTSLDLSGNEIDDKGAEHLGSLGSLTLLSLVNNKLGPKGVAQLAKLSRLTSLELARNRVGSAGAAQLSKMTRLMSLNLIDCHIGDAGAAHLAKLAELTKLALGRNNIGDEGAKSISKLAKLTSLHLWPNKVGDRGAEYLAELASLTSLILTSNQIGDNGAAHLVRLSRLTSLHLESNNIGDEGVKHLAKLTRLSELSLSSNNISDDGAAHLAKLAQLKDLTVGSNVSDDSAIVFGTLSQLRFLSLEGCGRFTDKGVLVLAEGPIGRSLDKLVLYDTGVRAVPKELIRSFDAQAIFRHVLAKGKRPLLAARLVVLGEGEAGKTHVRQRLVDDSFYYEPQHLSTHDIDMRTWTLQAPPALDELAGEITIRLWDFGGQPHLHASHRFFISNERNLHLLVVDATKTPDENRLDYWLGMIRREAQGGPVVVLVTKCDAPEGNVVNRPLGEISLEAIKTRFEAEDREWPNVVAVIDGYGWSHHCQSDRLTGKEQEGHRRRHEHAHAELVEAIRTAIAVVPGVSVTYPPGFFEVERWLEDKFVSEQDAQKHISLAAYRKACEECGLSRLQADDYLPVFRNLGLCHWVGDRADVRERFELEDLLFNPFWVKGPIYTLIRATAGEHQQGVIGEKQVGRLLPARESAGGADKFEAQLAWARDAEFWRRFAFTKTDRRLVLDLMRVCGLCFDLPTDAEGFRILLPDLLPTRGKKRWKKFLGPDVLRGTGSLTFLNEDVLMRCLGEWDRRDVDWPTEIWRDEVTIRRGSSNAVIQADVNARRVYVQIQGGGVADRVRASGAIAESLERAVSRNPHRCDDDRDEYARPPRDDEKRIEWEWEGADHDEAGQGGPLRVPKRVPHRVVQHVPGGQRSPAIALDKSISAQVKKIVDWMLEQECADPDVPDAGAPYAVKEFEVWKLWQDSSECSPAEQRAYRAVGLVSLMLGREFPPIPKDWDTTTKDGVCEQVFERLNEWSKLAEIVYESFPLPRPGTLRKAFDRAWDSTTGSRSNSPASARPPEEAGRQSWKPEDDG